MADIKISQLPAATTPLAGTEEVPLVQSGATKKVTVSNLRGTVVTAVTGTAPVVSSGGTTPAISMAAATTSVNGYLTSTDWTTFNNKYSVGGALGTPSSGTATNLTGLPLTTGVTGILPVANGGNGTATPALVAGTNVTISGSWPNQTINSTGGGGGGVTSFSAGTTGLTPATASTGVVTLAGTLAVANGGTGTTTPALVAGTNVTISGTWPNQTINSSGGGGMTYPGVGISNSTGSAWGTSYSTTGTSTVVALATSPTFVTPVLGTPTSGDFSTGTFTWPTFNQNTTGTAANVTGTVALANGGTGQTTAAAAITALTGAQTSAYYLRSNGTNATLSALSAADLTGTVAIASGGSGQTTAQTAMNAFAGAVTSGSYLRGNGANVVMATIQSGDVPTLNQNTTGTAANVTGTVAVANGGTGLTTLTAGYIPYGNGTSALGNESNLSYDATNNRLGVVGTGYSPNITLSDAATIAWDTTTGQVATFTFVSTNRTMGAPSSLVSGAFYALAVIQNAGSNTLTWNSIFKWPSGTAPTLSTAASAKDYFVFRSDGTNLYQQGISQAVA
jgi:hypothetical protein